MFTERGLHIDIINVYCTGSCWLILDWSCTVNPYTLSLLPLVVVIQRNTRTMCYHPFLPNHVTYFIANTIVIMRFFMY